MNDHAFQELLESVRQGTAILRGEIEPARRFFIDGSRELGTGRASDQETAGDGDWPISSGTKEDS
ncbi:MAG TPA: hypothetical protein VF746_21600 [Longimicrobium sp.]|jgi:hypothetical protein